MVGIFMTDEYTGKILRVDLSNNRIEQNTIPSTTLRQFVGGTGLGAKYLYDEVLPGTKWSNPENRLILAAGPLNATPLGGAGSISVVTKGPLTNGAGCCQANGYFGAFLRLCGFHAILIQGAAAELQYLYIDGETAELTDAGWLVGTDTYRTPDLIRHEQRCRPREMAVASIGPAGENCVKFAGIFCDYGHSASHNGLGAVMGAKKLKAIAVKRGKHDISMENPTRIRAIAKELLENVKTQSRGTYEYGTLNGLHGNAQRNMIPVKNYTTSTWKIDDTKWQKFSGEYIRDTYSLRRNSCWACQIHHCDMMQITEGAYSGEIVEEPEYEQFSAWSSAIGQEDVAAAMMLSKEVDGLGLETNEAGWVVGFAMECFETGVISKEDANGLELSWGNAESARLLLNLIAKRQGIGSILAEGVQRAAQKLGAEDKAIHSMKGNTPRGHDHRNRLTEQFDTCISNTGTLETWGGPIALGAAPAWEDIVEANLQDKGAMMFEDSLVTCRFNTRMNVDLLSQALSAVTGWSVTWENGMTIGRRIVQILRAFNIRHGIAGRELDRPSIRYGSVPDSGPAKGRSLHDSWDKMLDAYYSGMGWDVNGKPLPETLKHYGLDSVIVDLYP
jgi:aldehyde:ferredoxin oxidoreductase